jgi:hypothetical protein
MVDQIQGMGSMIGAGMSFRSEALTADQKSQIKSILSQYDPDKVTKEDAKSIFQAFKDAGIKPSPGMKEAIEEAGFDAEDLRAKGKPEGPPPPPLQGAGNNKSSGVNLSELKSLQDILSEYDLTNMTDEDESSLLSTLQQQGFMNPGIMIDLKS